MKANCPSLYGTPGTSYHEPFDKAFYKANNNLYMRLSSCIPLWLKKKLKKMLK